MVCRLPDLRLLAAFALSLLSPVVSGMATVVYVNSAGDDANSGMVDRPLRSMEALHQCHWSPGDAVYFRGGQTFTGTLVIPGGGSDAKPITIGSYGGGRATLDSAGNTLITGYNQGGFQFQDLNLKSSYSDSPASGILFYSDSQVGSRYPGITVSNCDLRGFGGPAIKISSSQPSNPGWTSVRVENCRVIGNGAGMAVSGYDAPVPGTYAIDSLQVTHSEFAENRGTGLSICGVARGLVDLCSFHDNRRVGGCWTWAAKNVMIQHCISYRNHRGSDNDGFGFDIDGGSVGCTIQYCLSYENDTAGFAIFDYPNSAETADDTIRYCVSENDVRSDREGGSLTINSWANSPIRNCNIYNCVTYLASRGGSSVCAAFMGIGRQALYGYQSGDISRCGFWNNILYLDGGGSDLVHLYCQPGANAPSQIAIAGNDYASSKNRPLRILTARGLYTNLAQWRAATGEERLIVSRKILDCGIFADPMCERLGQFRGLTNPALMAQSLICRPRPGSPCLSEGLDVRKQFHVNPGYTDFYGNPIGRNGSVTIGVAGPQSGAK